MATDANGVVLGAAPPGIPHLVIPFSLASDGTARTVGQGTSAEVIQCVANLVGTRPGTRFLVPTYGIVDPTFEGIDQQALKLAVANFEKRATVNVVTTPGELEYITVGVAGGTA